MKWPAYNMGGDVRRDGCEAIEQTAGAGVDLVVCFCVSVCMLSPKLLSSGGGELLSSFVSCMTVSKGCHLP